MSSSGEIHWTVVKWQGYTHLTERKAKLYTKISTATYTIIKKHRERREEKEKDLDKFKILSMKERRVAINWNYALAVQFLSLSYISIYDRPRVRQKRMTSSN